MNKRGKPRRAIDLEAIERNRTVKKLIRLSDEELKSLILLRGLECRDKELSGARLTRIEQGFRKLVADIDPFEELEVRRDGGLVEKKI